MTLNRWLRNKARFAVDQIFCSSSADVQRVGNVHSGWVMKKGLDPLVIYCAGVGQGISFELELAKTSRRPILVFDPSPQGLATMAEIDAGNIEFFPVGLAATTGAVEFSLTRQDGEASRSVADNGFGKVSFDCWDLATVMRRNGDAVIDLLKMDIEGFEYEIIDQFLEQGIPVRQLCVEFHPWLAPGRTFGRTWKTIAKLYRAGYRIIYKHRGDHTFVLKESRFRELVKNRTKEQVRWGDAWSKALIQR
ncbi:FkbM family methyltransferase [Tunturiibacter lichenicola]|uniref:FkbM family methyltransferase n=1 Tax=Tunturiibacter lichenicola TaxID=2051959 RepID=UPI0021B2D3AA|nr:FkbM family methyltransferase [Edaphobacter lichenicola]